MEFPDHVDDEECHSLTLSTLMLDVGREEERPRSNPFAVRFFRKEMFVELTSCTFMVHNLPVSVDKQLIYDLSPDIRDVKLFRKAGGKMALVEFVAKHCLTLDLVAELKALRSPDEPIVEYGFVSVQPQTTVEVRITPSPYCIREVMRAETRNEVRLRRNLSKEMASLRTELTRLRARETEVHARANAYKKKYHRLKKRTNTSSTTTSTTTSRSEPVSRRKVCSEGGVEGSLEDENIVAPPSYDAFIAQQDPSLQHQPTSQRRPHLNPTVVMLNIVGEWKQCVAAGESRRYMLSLTFLDRWRMWAKRKAEERLTEQLLAEEFNQREVSLQAKTYPCPVCLCDCPIDEIYVLDDCYHRYCLSCLSAYATDKIRDGQVKQLICPSPQCSSAISLTEIKHLVSSDLVARYETFTLRMALDSMTDVVWCPKADCGNAMIADPGNLMMVCTSGRCEFTFCFQCKEEWHADVTCEQYQQWKIDNNEADAKYAGWVKLNAKPCIGCKVPIEKNGGCNHMTCKQCKAQFCWLCGEAYQRGHFGKDGCKQFS